MQKFVVLSWGELEVRMTIGEFLVTFQIEGEDSEEGSSYEFTLDRTDTLDLVQELVTHFEIDSDEIVMADQDDDDEDDFDEDEDDSL